MRIGVYIGIVLVVCSSILGATVFRDQVASAAGLGGPSVTETNLDANGYIRTHEQGTANVNVTNPLTIGGTVGLGATDSAKLDAINAKLAQQHFDSEGNLKVVSATPSQRVIQVFNNTAVPAQTAFHSGYRDTSDCRAIAAFVQTDFSLDDSDVSLWMSVDGSINTFVGATPGIRVQGSWYFRAGSSSIPVFTPSAELVVVNGHDSAGTIKSAWLVCSR